MSSGTLPFVRVIFCLFHDQLWIWSLVLQLNVIILVSIVLVLENPLHPSLLLCLLLCFLLPFQHCICSQYQNSCPCLPQYSYGFRFSLSMEIPAVTIAGTSVIMFLLTHLRHPLQSQRVVMAELLGNWKQGHLWGQTMLVREYLFRSWKVEGWRLHSFAVATCCTIFKVYPYPVWTSCFSLCLLFFVVLPCPTMKNLALSSWLPPCSYSGAAVRSPQNLLFSRLNKDNSLSLSSQG